MRKKAKVEIFNISLISVPRISGLASLAEHVLSCERPGNINLVFCGNKQIQNLNHQFRKKNAVTDVLSFDYSENDIMGEIYISTPRAKEQAIDYHTSFYRELRRLIVHGCLHLAGYDHHKIRDAKIMEEKEKFYLV